jgi:7-carboxy-7-deazaguanine synthase
MATFLDSQVFRSDSYMCYITFVSFDGLLVTEIFRSLQGETSLSGIPFVFVRLTGCNLRCVYCDSSYAFKGQNRMSVDAVFEEVKRLAPEKGHHVLLTGGEPLLQRQTRALCDRLLADCYTVSIETHGEVSIETFTDCRIIMDLKTPGSGMCRERFRENLKFLDSNDEVKFVLANPSDYEWAKTWVRSGAIRAREILFSAAQPHAMAPGEYPGVDLCWLAEKILEDRLPVRLQTQLHKQIWGSEKKGV